MTRRPAADPQLFEASGLASGISNPKLLYTLNDSGGLPTIYAIDHAGNIFGKIHLPGLKNRDWEDIATGTDPTSGKPCVYVGEIGDNAARYPSIFVYRFAEPVLQDTLVTVTAVDSLEITFEDGPRDCEALFVDPRSGDICLISKREEKVGVYLVRYPQATDTVNIARKVAELPYMWVTAADISPNGKHILVKTYTSINRYKRGRGESLAQAFRKPFKAMPYQLEPQGEAVAWDRQGKGYFTLSERQDETPADLFYYQ